MQQLGDQVATLDAIRWKRDPVPAEHTYPTYAIRKIAGHHAARVYQPSPAPPRQYTGTAKASSHCRAVGSRRRRELLGHLILASPEARMPPPPSSETAALHSKQHTVSPPSSAGDLHGHLSSQRSFT